MIKKDTIGEDTMKILLTAAIFTPVVLMFLILAIKDKNVVITISSAVCLLVVISISLFALTTMKKDQLKYYENLKNCYLDVLQNYDFLIKSNYELKTKDHYDNCYHECLKKISELKSSNEHVAKQEQFDEL